MVELLVSITVLVVGLVALTQLYVAALWTYDRGRNLSVAVQRAQLELERVESLAFSILNTGDLVTNDPTTTCYPSNQYTELTGGVRGVSFTVPQLRQSSGSVQIDHYNNEPNLLRVVVQIGWRDQPNNQNAMTITTLVTNR